MADNEVQDAYDAIMAAHNMTEEQLEQTALTVERMIKYLDVVRKHVNGEITGELKPFLYGR
jgi:hypothetical protein